MLRDISSAGKRGFVLDLWWTVSKQAAAGTKRTPPIRIYETEFSESLNANKWSGITGLSGIRMIFHYCIHIWKEFKIMARPPVCQNYWELRCPEGLNGSLNASAKARPHISRPTDFEATIYDGPSRLSLSGVT